MCLTREQRDEKIRLFSSLPFFSLFLLFVFLLLSLLSPGYDERQERRKKRKKAKKKRATRNALIPKTAVRLYTLKFVQRERERESGLDVLYLYI